MGRCIYINIYIFATHMTRVGADGFLLGEAVQQTIPVSLVYHPWWIFMLALGALGLGLLGI